MNRTSLICGCIVWGICSVCPAQEAETSENEESPWSGNVSLTGEYRYGNTVSRSSTVTGEALFSRDKNEFASKIRSYFASDNTGITARNTSLSVKYDRLFTERFSWYLSEELYNDRFLDLELRSTAGTGAAFRIWKDKKKKLTVELGAAYITEDHIVYENAEETTGRAAVQIELKAGGNIVFRDSLEVFPSFEESGEYTMKNECIMLTGLGAGWAMKLNHLLQHDTNPPAGINKTDVTLSLGLQYSF